MTDQPVTVRFGKLDNVTGLLVAGAEFSIYRDAEWQVQSQRRIAPFTPLPLKPRLQR